jgi:hypothetical protein
MTTKSKENSSLIALMLCTPATTHSIGITEPHQWWIGKFKRHIFKTFQHITLAIILYKFKLRYQYMSENFPELSAETH